MMMVGLTWVMDPRVKRNRYYMLGRTWKAFPSYNGLGLLRLGFQIFYKRVNYQLLIIFDQLGS